jgi:hypothetical protein
MFITRLFYEWVGSERPEREAASNACRMDARQHALRQRNGPAAMTVIATPKPFFVQQVYCMLRSL